MIHLRYNRDAHSLTPNEAVDSDRIVEIFRDRGYSISFFDALDAWSDYSADLSAGWLFLPESDEQIFDILFSRFVEFDSAYE